MDLSMLVVIKILLNPPAPHGLIELMKSARRKRDCFSLIMYVLEYH